MVDECFPPSPTNKKFQFGIRHLLVLTANVASVFGALLVLGFDFGQFFSMAIGMIGYGLRLAEKPAAPHFDDPCAIFGAAFGGVVVIVIYGVAGLSLFSINAWLWSLANKVSQKSTGDYTDVSGNPFSDPK